VLRCAGLYFHALLQVPDELDNIPMVDEALASAAYTNTAAGARTPSRKTRWTTEQIEALIEGVEKYGLSAWRTIVMVSVRHVVCFSYAWRCQQHVQGSWRAVCWHAERMQLLQPLAGWQKVGSKETAGLRTP
jgi:hypothetical protein